MNKEWCKKKLIQPAILNKRIYNWSKFTYSYFSSRQQHIKKTCQLEKQVLEDSEKSFLSRYYQASLYKLLWNYIILQDNISPTLCTI